MFLNGHMDFDNFIQIDLLASFPRVMVRGSARKLTITVDPS